MALPIALALALESEAIVKLLFERGRFTAEDTHLVARIQTIHAIYIPTFAISMVAVRMVNAIAASRMLFYTALSNVAVNLGLNMFLVPSLGLEGVVWADVGTYASSALFLWVFLSRIFRQGASLRAK